eukprot:8328508-Pyramimonas_sp.AAC.1
MVMLSSSRDLSTSRAPWGFWARMVDLLEILRFALRQPPTRTLAALDAAAPAASSGPSTRTVVTGELPQSRYRHSKVYFL